MLRFVLLFALTVSASASLMAQDSLQKLVDGAAQSALKRFTARGLKAENLAITLIDSQNQRASFNGATPIYPASVVKLFYLGAAHRWMEDGKLQYTPEVRRALHDMIVDSSNDATNYIVEVLTGAGGGAELSPDELKLWMEKRQAVNRFYAALGYTGINASQKTWNDGPYGRERQGLGPNYENRNKLTSDATARILNEIARGEFVSAQRSREMMALLKRDVKNSNDPQATDFIGVALKDMPGAKLWSKAGWTSTARHDAAYIELPNGKRCVLVIFTTGVANEKEIIPFIARDILKNLPQ
jgi:hypothetical protein